MLRIFVHFGLGEAAAGFVDADILATLRKAIKAEFSSECAAGCDAHKLIVQNQRYRQQTPCSGE